MLEFAFATIMTLFTLLVLLGVFLVLYRMFE